MCHNAPLRMRDYHNSVSHPSAEVPMTTNNSHEHEGATFLTSIPRNPHCPAHSHSGPSKGEEQIPVFYPELNLRLQWLSYYESVLNRSCRSC